MKIRTRNAVLAALLATASASVFAAESADLAITGTIRPSACNVTLSNSGELDFGTISAQDLSATGTTKLPARDLTMTITCDAATQSGYAITDNRAGSVIAVSGGTPAGQLFGLGSIDSRSLGAYKISYGAATADGANITRYLYSSNNTSWTRETGNLVVSKGYTFSWSGNDQNTPTAFTSVSQTLSIEPHINSTANLPALTTGLKLDGSATIQVTYL